MKAAAANDFMQIARALSLIASLIRARERDLHNTAIMRGHRDVCLALLLRSGISGGYTCAWLIYSHSTQFALILDSSALARFL